jgi:hemolysin D
VGGAEGGWVGGEVGRRRLGRRRRAPPHPTAALQRHAADEPAAWAGALAQFEANRRALADAQAQERATLQRARAELAAAAEQRDKLASVLPVYREQDAAFRKLQTEGFAGKLMQLDKQRELIEKEGELAAQGHAIEAAQATIVQSERRLAQLESTLRQRLQAERSEAQAQAARLEQELAKAEHRGQLLALRAPHDGIVKDLVTHSRGTVVQPGAVLMSLVPDHEPLMAEVWLKNSDAGFVEPGQKVMLKLAAYSFQKYGLLEGRIAQVSADATDPSARAGSPAEATSTAAADGGPVFKVLVALDAQALQGRGEPTGRSQGEHARPSGQAQPNAAMRLGAGMAVTAEIHQGTRSVLEYLLSPIQRVAQEAARER